MVRVAKAVVVGTTLLALVGACEFSTGPALVAPSFTVVNVGPDSIVVTALNIDTDVVIDPIPFPVPVQDLLRPGRAVVLAPNQTSEFKREWISDYRAGARVAFWTWRVRNDSAQCCGPRHVRTSEELRRMSARVELSSALR
jgi:hypothetical protein